MTKFSKFFVQMKIMYGILFVCLIGCTSNSNDALKLDMVHKKGNIPLIKILKIIRLEKNDSSLIGDVTKVDYYNDNYYVFDEMFSEALFLFDSTGQYINKTSKGKGVGEVIRPQTFNFNRFSNEILLWDQGIRKMIFFNPELKFQHSFTNIKMMLWDFEIFKGNKMLTYTQSYDIQDSTEMKQTFYYYLRDTKGKVIKSFLPENPNYAMENYILISPIAKNKDETLLITPFDFNIYSYKNEEVRPFMQVDFGRYGLDAQEIKKNKLDYMELVRNDSRIVTMDFILNSDKVIAFSYFQDAERRFVIYSRRNGEIYYSENIFQSGILPKCKIHSIVNNHFIGIVKPEDYIIFSKRTHMDMQTIINPDENDNPYIIVFKIN